MQASPLPAPTRITSVLSSIAILVMHLHKLSRRLVLGGAAVLATLSIIACSKPEPPAPAAAPAEPAPAAAPHTYVVGTDPVYPPFEWQNDKGEIVGFEVELLTAIAERAGFQVKFVATPWEGMFNALAQGDRDMLMHAITITDERRQTMDFSQPYFDASQLIAVPKDSKVAKLADLAKLRVAVQTGTTGDEVVSRTFGKTHPKIRRFESIPLALKELESGGVDAVVADNGLIAHYVANNGARFKTVSDPDFPTERYGMVVRKGNAELLALLDKGLAAVRADGSYARIHARYFGTEEAR